jgi:hypothetical protein
MDTPYTTQVLTIFGIICNGFILFFEFMIGFLYFPFMLFTFLWFVIGIVLPMIAYNDIPKGSRGSAGVLLILSGLASLLFIFFIGGILLIVAGALAASWNPYPIPPTGNQQQWVHRPSVVRSSSQPRFHPLGPYHEYDGESIWVRTDQSISASTAQTKKCVNCGAELERIDQYCHVCGAHVGWY